jgi:hypothetical protein
MLRTLGQGDLFPPPNNTDTKNYLSPPNNTNVHDPICIFLSYYLLRFNQITMLAITAPCTN